VDDRSSTGSALSKHTVIQTLGGHHEFSAVEVHLTSSPLSTDACYLVCTDGLSDVVPTAKRAKFSSQLVQVGRDDLAHCDEVRGTS